MASLAIAVLSVVQWGALLDVQSGKEAFCNLGEGLDCATVWAAPAAKELHARTGVPVAGWGLVWGLGALWGAVAVWIARQRGRSDAAWVGVVRIFALAGAVGAIFFFSLSLTMGAWCLTCVGTYVLVGIYGAWAFGLVPRKPAERRVQPWLMSLGLVLTGYLAVLWPGLKTPVEPVGVLSDGPTSPLGAQALRQFLRELPEASRRALWRALVEYRNQRVVDGSRFGTRRVDGPAHAPTHIVDFFDILCVHCGRLNQAMNQVKKRAPKGSFRREARLFPLDAECNPKLTGQNRDRPGTRCAGARLLICLEDHASYASVKDRFFREQSILDAERVFRIAEEGSGLTRAELEACVRAPETDQKLLEDIEYAWLYKLRGTPLVVLNGKKGSAAGPFIFAMILAGGDAAHPAFEALAPSSRPALR